MKTIPVLSLWQPWASLVAIGEKNIETRSWMWPGDLPAILAIHAAKKWSGILQDMCLTEPFLSALQRHGLGVPFRSLSSNTVSRGVLPFGKVVCVVRLVECISTNFLPPKRPFLNVKSLAAKYVENFPNERQFGDYTFSRYAWAFDQRLHLDKPIDLVGHRGIWQWEATPEIHEWAKVAMALQPQTPV